MKRIRHILVATDFSEVADRIIDDAIDLALQVDARITLMHSYEIPIYGFPDGALLAASDVAARIATAAQDALRASIESRKGRGVAMVGLIRNGSAWEEVNKTAVDLDVDLVIVGTHGRKGLSRALLGSVAQRIVQHAIKPVLVIHPEGGGHK